MKLYESEEQEIVVLEKVNRLRKVRRFVDVAVKEFAKKAKGYYVFGIEFHFMNGEIHTITFLEEKDRNENFKMIYLDMLAK